MTPIEAPIEIASEGLHGGLRAQHGAGYERGDTPERVIELAGSIKWFDLAKGYGFVVPDNGMPDILLHVTCLRRDGYQAAYKGARVAVAALRGPHGLQALRILSMDAATAEPPIETRSRRSHAPVTATGGLERAQVKWFNRLRGFGFLTTGTGAPDIFVHVVTLRRFGLTGCSPANSSSSASDPAPRGWRRPRCGPRATARADPRPTERLAHTRPRPAASATMPCSRMTKDAGPGMRLKRPGRCGTLGGKRPRTPHDHTGGWTCCTRGA